MNISKLFLMLLLALPLGVLAFPADGGVAGPKANATTTVLASATPTGYATTAFPSTVKTPVVGCVFVWPFC